MKKSVYDYFVDLDKQDLPRNEEGAFVIDKDRIKSTRESFLYGHPSISINDTPYYKKSASKDLIIMEHASSKMYNEIGLLTPPTYLLGSSARHDCSVSLITQYLPSIKKLYSKIASKALKSRHMVRSRFLSDKKWDLIHNPDIRKIFQYYMTPECLDELIGLFLIDELRSEVDRHDDNYFFYKTSHTSKYEGVIAIDHAYTEIANRHRTDEAFKRFLNSKYAGMSPTGIRDYDESHSTRINTIKNLIQNQDISPENIKLLKTALLHDFPEDIYNAGDYLYLKQCQIPLYDAVSRLWEYNRQELGRELGL